MKKNHFIYSMFVLSFLYMMFNFNIVKAEEYDGELGYSYSSSQTIFKIKSSTASNVKVVVEGVDSERCPSGMCPLTKDDNTNVWIGYATGDLNGKEYSFIIEYENSEVYNDVLDPYGKYINSTGNKNVIVDEDVLNFDEWLTQPSSINIKDKNKIIYGIDVENFTNHQSWKGNFQYKGKLLGLIDTDTKYNNVLTGYDYIKSLGISYIEFSKVYDVNSPFAIDSTYSVGNYDYSGSLELKQVINAYYLNNIGIILTFDYKDLSQAFIENLNKVDKNKFNSNTNVIDVDDRDVKDYIEDVILYYAENYKLAGIKLSNMADYDVEFINELSSKLHEINETIIFYGDGSYVEENKNKAGENNLKNLSNTKMLNGSLNYALFGDLLGKDVLGIVGGNYDEEIIETLKFALLSSANNGEVDYSLVNGVSYKEYWGNESSYDLINYIGKREGLSIFDKLLINNITGENIIKQKVITAYATMMFSGGIPYIYSGEEFLISYLDTTNDSNSICTENNSFCFRKNEEHKKIDWSYAYKNIETINVFKTLINFRKSSSLVVQTNPKVIENNISIYLNESCPGVVGYIRKYPGAYANETEKVFVVFNYSNNDYVLEDISGKGWNGLYKLNEGTYRDGEKIVLKANSLYSEEKIKQPKISPIITLLIVVAVIGGIYSLNIFLSKRLVEKKGYDIQDISKKYRPFVNKKKTNQEKTEETNEEENKNGNE